MLSDLPRPRACAPRRRPSACECTRRTRSPRSIRKRSSDPETCRQSSIAHTRSAPRPRAQREQSRGALSARQDRLLAEQLAGRRRDRGDRVRALVGVRTEHDHDLRPPPLDWVGHPADTACSGRCHAPIKSRQGIHDRRRATQRKAVRPDGRQPERESARRRSRSLHRPSDITDETNPNSKPESSSPDDPSDPGASWGRERAPPLGRLSGPASTPTEG